MSDDHEPDAWRYEIRVRGRLDASWSEWFHGLTVTCEGTDTVLVGPLPDQAALRGILARVWDLGLTLVSLVRMEAGSGEG
ncbi:MAG: hypothetical protein QME94_01300 [Anaerolineae bacterium]|nr:hypothetical protein [Anaerolineae bacterium]